MAQNCALCIATVYILMCIFFFLGGGGGGGSGGTAFNLLHYYCKWFVEYF